MTAIPTHKIETPPTTKPTATVAPSKTPTPTPAFTATAVTIASDDPFWKDLQSAGYRLLFGGSLIGPAQLTYSAYGFIDHALEPAWFSERLTPEVCRLAIYRSDGQTNQLLRSFGAPQHTVSGRYHGFPVLCELVNWDNPIGTARLAAVNDETKRLLHLHQFSSDINQNGKPEFAVVDWYCPNACYGNEGAIHFYEIQDTSTVIHITDNLPGAVYPWQIVHSGNPLTISVFDIGLQYVPGVDIETAWVYQWNGVKFVDVSTQYSDEYKSQADSIALQVREDFGRKFEPNPRDEANVLTVLFLYEKAGLREQGLKAFLDLTDSANWPGTEPYATCWLQIARANAQEQLSQGKPFTLPRNTFFLELNLSAYWKTFDQTKYDLSGCKAFRP